MVSGSEVTQKELSDRLGLSMRQIHNLVEAGMPKATKQGKNVYPWPAALRWYIDYKVRLQEPGDLEEAEKRKAVADARLAEIKLAREEGQLVPIADTVATVDGMLADLRAQILTLPQRVAGKLVGLKTIVEAQAVMDGAVADLLTTLAKGQE